MSETTKRKQSCYARLPIDIFRKLYKNAIIEKLCKILNKKLYIGGEFTNWKWANEEEYLNISVDPYKSIKEKFSKEQYLSLKIGKLEFNMMEKNIFFYDFNWKFGSWWRFTDHLKENADKESFNHYQNQLKKIKFCSKLFGSTKIILFNDRDHQDIEDKLDEGMTIVEALNDKRWRIITKHGVN